MADKKLNVPELAHYVVGGLILILITPALMSMFPVPTATNGLWFSLFMSMNFWVFSAAWILAYIIVDQILHVVVKGEKISIVR